MHILILEDEIPAYKKLVAQLRTFFGPSITWDNVRTVKEGVEKLTHGVKYDLILSDIKLLDGLAFEVFQKVTIQAPIIFCTAYDEHLLEAFRTNGIAYILKPYSQSDLYAALEKYTKLFGPISYEKELFFQLKEVLEGQEKNYKKRFAIKKPDGIKLLDALDISIINAKGDFCTAYDVHGKLHTLSKPMSALQEVLDPQHFFRINRSQMVNIKHLQKIEPYSKNRLSLRLLGLTDTVITSSSVTSAFRKWLEQ
ncbi:LytR/AlgR family response regulator transcription factor [Spongiimicrobium salis]|uniref:LytR/AlgR family response regulator transcription factor n=1 Tax=Spongiimicrobium salis TaxID=1667022 RepID=UPI00374CECF5